MKTELPNDSIIPVFIQGKKGTIHTHELDGTSHYSKANILICVLSINSLNYY